MLAPINANQLARDTRLARLGPDILGGPEVVGRAAANVAGAGTVELGEALLACRREDVAERSRSVKLCDVGPDHLRQCERLFARGGGQSGIGGPHRHLPTDTRPSARHRPSNVSVFALLGLENNAKLSVW